MSQYWVGVSSIAAVGIAKSTPCDEGNAIGPVSLPSSNFRGCLHLAFEDEPVHLEHSPRMVSLRGLVARNHARRTWHHAIA